MLIEKLPNRPVTIFNGDNAQSIIPWMPRTPFRLNLHGEKYANFALAGKVGKPLLQASKAKAPSKAELLALVLPLLTEDEITLSDDGVASTKLSLGALKKRLKDSGKYAIVA